MTISSFFRSVLLASTVALSTMAGVPGQAQMRHTALQLAVPFSFTVGSTHLPAGSYTLEQPADYILHFQSGDKVVSSLFHQEWTSKPSEHPKVIFHRYGDRFFLREVRTRDSALYIALPESPEERNVRKGIEMASRAPQAERVELAALTATR